MDFKCNKCEFIYKVTKVKFSHVGEEWVPNIDTKCPKCKEGVLELITEDLTVVDIQVVQNTFMTLSSSEKKAVLKKRAQEHFKKFSKSAVEQKRHETINDVKTQFERKINNA